MPSATINFTGSVATKISKALRKEQDLDQDGTAEQFEDWLRKVSTDMIHRQEHKTNQAAVVTTRVTFT